MTQQEGKDRLQEAIRQCQDDAKLNQALALFGLPPISPNGQADNTPPEGDGGVRGNMSKDEFMKRLKG